MKTITFTPLTRKTEEGYLSIVTAQRWNGEGYPYPAFHIAQAGPWPTLSLARKAAQILQQECERDNPQPSFTIAL